MGTMVASAEPLDHGSAWLGPMHDVLLDLAGGEILGRELVEI